MKPVPVWSDNKKAASASAEKAVLLLDTGALAETRGTTDKFWLVAGKMAESQLTEKSNISLCAGGIL